MIRTFVVEDEPAIRIGVESMLKTLKLPLDLCGSFSNGRAAFEKLAGLRPDLIVTDIRMPLMDGLELAKAVKEVAPEVEFLILSGYDDFEYARTAMCHGVGGYLLKPPTRLDMETALCPICEKIEKRRRLELRAAVTGRSGRVSGSSGGSASVLDTGLPLCAVAVCLGPFSARSHDYLLPDHALWNNDLLEREIARQLAEGVRCVVADAAAANEKVLLFALPAGSIEPARRAVELLKALVRSLGMPVSAVISQPFNGMEKLPVFYRALRARLQQIVLIGCDRTELMAENALSPDPDAIDRQARARIAALLEGDDYTGFLEEYKRLCHKWESTRVPQAICEFSLKYLVADLFARYEDLRRSYRLEGLFAQAEGIVCSALSLEAFERTSASMLSELLHLLMANRTGLNINDTVELLWETIHSGYAQPISIEQFAKKYGYHATYISNTFTATKGISPTRLVTTLRIEVAKELLRETNAPLKAIAAQVGYNDVSYISRVFKEMVGQSPREYREGGKKKNQSSIILAPTIIPSTGCRSAGSRARL